MSQRCEFICGKPPGGMDVCWADLGKVAVQLELPALTEARLEWALDGDLSEMAIALKFSRLGRMSEIAIFRQLLGKRPEHKTP